MKRRLKIAAVAFAGIAATLGVTSGVLRGGNDPRTVPERPDEARAGSVVTGRPEASWSGDRVLTVDAGGTEAEQSIPPGRYRVQVIHSAVPGTVSRCSARPCSALANFIDGMVASGTDSRAMVEIMPTDRAVELVNVRLIAIE
ncbi:MAG: hypothetical protein JWN03_2104 [Nocardia sp.]|uniref:hypothetical protein n=1 Tax=Nocardia sp. TaxID=1821 RepID=UPI002620D687|nr:hypothetical protein [Nocardia sp.]MCU1641829.1 hypothetical protein [Nocardia sp.]